MISFLLAVLAFWIRVSNLRGPAMDLCIVQLAIGIRLIQMHVCWGVQVHFTVSGLCFPKSYHPYINLNPHKP